MKIFEFITYPHISLSQVEKTKKPLEVSGNLTNSNIISNKKIASSEEKATQNPYIAIRLSL